MPASKTESAKLPTSADRIADVLRTRIVRGEIEGGKALRQDHVASEFQSSHVPVREAFQRLEAQGLVVTLPRRGVRVTTLSPESIKETVEMRAALEVLALKHSVPKLTDAHIDQLELAQSMCSQAASLIEWDAANRTFHECLVNECAMPRLLAALKQLQLTN